MKRIVTGGRGRGVGGLGWYFSVKMGILGVAHDQMILFHPLMV